MFISHHGLLERIKKQTVVSLFVLVCVMVCFTNVAGLSPDLQSMEQIRRIMRPTDVPDTGKISIYSPSCFKQLHVSVREQSNPCRCVVA